jgi:hypothetical protein
MRLRKGRAEAGGIGVARHMVLVMNEAFHFLTPVDPEVSEAMGAAFQRAWGRLCSAGERPSAQQACDARIRLARAILEQVHRGERCPFRLSEYALASLDFGE